MSSQLFKNVLLCLFLGNFPVKATDNPPLVSSRSPTKLTFQELLELVEESPTSATNEHLKKLLSEPFISNEASLAGVKPIRPTHSTLGPVLRVAEWNIERGLNQQNVELTLSRSRPLPAIADGNTSALSGKLDDELEILRDADVVILDEVDLGMKRTRYQDVARQLAQALHFNYVYGVEFIELDRLYLGEKKLDLVENQRPRDLHEEFGVDPTRYQGLEGNVILSRYPIRDARIVRLPECYDWFHGEIKQISNLERARRWSAQKIFDESVRRQVRRGGRMALIADLVVPEAPNQQITVVAPHLEDYCTPSCRREQMNFLLDSIKGIANPVVLGGDLNTNDHDGTPTSVRYEILKRIKSYRFWAKEALFWFIPVPFAGVMEIPINYFKNHHDPTALNVPLLLPNHAKELFQDTRSFRFTDGGSFDFDGLSRWAVGGRSRTLAQSNQRAWKGFVPTFAFRRTYFHIIGRYKLDWFFVKPASSADSSAGLRPLTPSLGRTLTLANTAFSSRTSDHCPMTVDLPLTPSATDPGRSARKIGEQHADLGGSHYKP